MKRSRQKIITIIIIIIILLAVQWYNLSIVSSANYGFGITSKLVEEVEKNVSLAAAVTNNNGTLTKNSIIVNDTNYYINYSFSSSSACSNRLALLSRALRENPEENAVRALTLLWHNNSIIRSNGTTNNTTDKFQTFDGLTDELISQAFWGQRIYSFGDSTLRHFSQSISWRLHFYDHHHHDDNNNSSFLSWNNVSMEEANKQFQLWQEQICPANNRICLKATSSGAFKDTKHNNTTIFKWSCTRGEVSNFTPVKESWWKTWKEKSPQIILVNYGIHLLHFIGYGRNSNAIKIDQWIYYEKWLQEVLDNASNVGCTLLLFKTNNRLCEEKFYGMYVKGNKKYSNAVATILNNSSSSSSSSIPYKRRRRRNKNPLDVLIECEKIVRAYEESKDWSSEAIGNYCRYGTFNGAGSLYLNDRLKKFVASLDIDRKGNHVYKDMIVQVFDDHDVMHCRYTKDGIHYQAQNLLRMRLLANQLDCILSE